MQPEQDHSARGNTDWSRSLESSTVAAAFELDSTGTIVHINQRLRELLGERSSAPLTGRRIEDLLVQPADARVLRRAQRKGGLTDVTLRLRLTERGQVVLRGDLVPNRAGTGLLGLFVDATELTKLRDSMQRSARLEALGSLTSGVAHDFNNLLTVLIGNLALAAEGLRSRPDDFAKLKSARDAATRGADLIQQLLAFARQHSIASEPLNPARVIGNLVPLVGRALGTRVTLEAKLDGYAGTVQGNVAQLESVIVNLAVNARDAMESGGKVTIGVCEREIADAEAALRGLESGGIYTSIDVSDNGSGIPKETLEHVFDPFFSTKGDEGSGLGLAMVRNYAMQFKGAAHIESQPGQGTTVSLLFPRCAETVDETCAKTMPLSTLPTGSENVLILASDELRTTISQMLSVLGYVLHGASRPDEATRLLQEHDCALLIVDSPQADSVTGILAKAATDAGDRLCRVVQLRSSGDPERAVRIPPNVRILAKPFSLADLAKTVRATLDAADPPDRRSRTIGAG